MQVALNCSVYQCYFMQVEVKAIPIDKKELGDCDGGRKMRRVSMPDPLTFGGLPPPPLHHPFEPTIRDKMCFHSITVMKVLFFQQFDHLKTNLFTMPTKFTKINQFIGSVEQYWQYHLFLMQTFLLKIIQFLLRLFLQILKRLFAVHIVFKFQEICLRLNDTYAITNFFVFYTKLWVIFSYICNKLQHFHKLKWEKFGFTEPQIRLCDYSKNSQSLIMQATVVTKNSVKHKFQKNSKKL